MMRLASLFAALLLVLAPADKTLAQALERFRAALASAPESRSAALAELVGLGDLAAAPDLMAELASSCRRVSDNEASLSSKRQDEEQYTALEAKLRLALERDGSLRMRLNEVQKALETARVSLAGLKGRADVESRWRDELTSGLTTLLAGADDARRKKAEAGLWFDLEKNPTLDVRAASARALGRVGARDSCLRLAKFSVEATAKLGRSRDRLAKELVEVRKEERRLQAEAELAEGRVSDASRANYDRVRAAAASLQEEIADQEHLASECAAAAAQALEREDDEALAKTVLALLRTLKKENGAARLDLARLLSSADRQPVRDSVMALLDDETDPSLRIELLEGLVRRADPACATWLLERGLNDSTALFAAHSARSLARLRVKAAIPVLIERLAGAVGILQGEFSAALVSLTGQDFHGNVELWRRWWQSAGESFEVPAEPAPPSVGAAAASNSGFFGIDTGSQRVLFVLDLSGSMNFAMLPGKNPDDSPNAPPDLPGRNDISRLTAAKQALIKAVGGLRQGARFNLVTYASDVWTWSDEPVEMSPQSRASFLSYVEGLKAVGGTNIYGALLRGLDLAGATAQARWTEPVFDTIYLLTDGKASIGVETGADAVLAMVRERNRNTRVVIHTIGLSAAHDASFLRRLADENDGLYVAP